MIDPFAVPFKAFACGLFPRFGAAAPGLETFRAAFRAGMQVPAGYEAAGDSEFFSSAGVTKVSSMIAEKTFWASR
jgi:hypothetical protein